MQVGTPCFRIYKDHDIHHFAKHIHNINLNFGYVKPVLFNTGQWNNVLVCKIVRNNAQHRKKKAFRLKKNVPV